MGEVRHGYDDIVRVPKALLPSYFRARDALAERAPALPPSVRDRLALAQARYAEQNALNQVMAKARRDMAHIITQTGALPGTVRTASDRAIAAVAIVPGSDKLSFAERQIIQYEFWVQALRYLVSTPARAAADRRLQQLREQEFRRQATQQSKLTITWPTTLPIPVVSPGTFTPPISSPASPASPASTLDPAVYTAPQRPPSPMGQYPVLVYAQPPALPAGQTWLYHRCAQGHHYNAAARYDPQGDVAYEVPSYAWCSCGAQTYVTLPRRTTFWTPRLRVSCPECGNGWYPVTLLRSGSNREWAVSAPVSVLEQRCGACMNKRVPGTPPAPSWLMPPPGTQFRIKPELLQQEYLQEYDDLPFPADGKE